MSKTIYLTEEQAKYINEASKKKKNLKWFVEPDKVLRVKKYLDAAFKRGRLHGKGDNGYPQSIKIVAMIGTDGSELQNMDDKLLKQHLLDRFQSLYADKEKLDAFINLMIPEWYEKRIKPNGLLSVNMF